VGRADDPRGGLTGDEHPDDPRVFDLAAPVQATIWAPMLTDFAAELGRVAGVDADDSPAGRTAEVIAAEIDQVLSEVGNALSLTTITVYAVSPAFHARQAVLSEVAKREELDLASVRA
jgi:hypothetical protein